MYIALSDERIDVYKNIIEKEINMEAKTISKIFTAIYAECDELAKTASAKDQELKSAIEGFKNLSPDEQTSVLKDAKEAKEKFELSLANLEGQFHILKQIDPNDVTF